MKQDLKIAGRLAKTFIQSKLTPLAIAGALFLGLVSLRQTPREEEPQIVVPMLDVFVRMPGASAAEVEQRVTAPMESLIRELDGVEYVYSTSSPGLSLLVVRFYVGEKEEDAVVRAYSKLYANLDRIPLGAGPPLVKVRSINNVPIVALTLHGRGYDPARLRLIAGELEREIRRLDNVSETAIIGGQPRQMKVELDSARLAAFDLSPAAVAQQLRGAETRTAPLDLSFGDTAYKVQVGSQFASARDLESVVLKNAGGRPAYLRDVATLQEAPADPEDYVLFGSRDPRTGVVLESSAVTITVAKRKGANATDIANAIAARVAALRGPLLPPDLKVDFTRNYGETAKDKSNELLKHLLLATLSVTLLIALALGWRESGVVLLAIPVTLALTLGIFYLFGYTLNRVTLFALIFSIGILVDDAIVVVENMVRHFRLPENQGRPLHEAAIEAVEEVGSPTILATVAVIAAILPMAMVRGLMGPYMRPIPVGASAAMVFSLLVAFMVSPWAALRLLGKHGKHSGHAAAEGRVTALYRRQMSGLIRRPRKRAVFFLVMIGLLLAAFMLVPLKLVRMKMLPFDNKSEFQVIVDMPEGATLERTTAVAQELARKVAETREVKDYQIYAGAAGPYNFNGLVRHYFLRRGGNVADIQVNLVSRHERGAQSHDIAKAMRTELQPIAQSAGANIKVAEVPPGPPVLQTLVAEIYGPDHESRIGLAQQVKQVFHETPGVVDVDWYVEDPQPQLDLQVDWNKAGVAGVAEQQLVADLETGVRGVPVGLLHDPDSKEDIPVSVRLSRASRANVDSLAGLRVPSANGGQVPAGSITRVVRGTAETSIYRKDLRPVVYVTGDVAGEEESPAYAILKMKKAVEKLKAPDGGLVAQLFNGQPEDTAHYSLKWDGEWQITYEVFRDLGLAFAAVLVGIYVLVVGWFRSFLTPLVIMAPIPLTLVGILPAHALMGAFFTATSMIGFIAGAGIIVRNSIILVDFIELRRAQGMSLEDAVVDAGAVRFRPMLLTAAAVVVGASVILFDPIFQGLAISLMAGEVASTLLSRMAVPVLYYLVKRNS